jgi:hypothetical protein
MSLISFSAIIIYAASSAYALDEKVSLVEIQVPSSLIAIYEYSLTLGAVSNNLFLKSKKPLSKSTAISTFNLSLLNEKK